MKKLNLFIVAYILLVGTALIIPSGWVSLIALIIIFYGGIYLILDSVMFLINQRKISSLSKKAHKMGYHYLGPVKITKTPSGGWSNITDKSFFYHHRKHIFCLVVTSSDIRQVGGIPYRHATTGNDLYLISSIDNHFYLFKKS